MATPDTSMPDYVRNDRSGTGDPDIQPSIGTDPMTTAEPSVEKTIIAPDPEKVREAEESGAVGFETGKSVK
ncbi:MAG: hypothetical protein AAGG50_11525 [Bacteroidota bacterium]